jgi:hypothetical protein
MSGLDALPPDQRAVLQLVLRQGRTYGQLADLLKIDPRVVRERARLGAEALAAPPPELDGDDRVEIVDYLLGQDPLGRELLEESAPARSWGAELSAVLAPLSSEPLPEVPGDATAAPADAVAAEPTADSTPTAPAPDQPAEAEPERGLLAGAAADVRASRLGGAALIGGIVIFVVALVIVLLNLGGSDDKAGVSTPATTTTSAQTTTATTGTSTTGATPKPLGSANLKAAQSGSKAVGVAQLLEQGTTAGFVVAAKGITTAKDTYHGVWLSGANVKPLFLGSVRNQDVKSGRISAVAPVPKSIKSYTTMLVTLEPITASKKAPATPGQTILSGPLKITGSP